VNCAKSRQIAPKKISAKSEDHGKGANQTFGRWVPKARLGPAPYTHFLRLTNPLGVMPVCRRSAGFQTRCAADFQIGIPSAGLEICDTADLEVCATKPPAFTIAFFPGSLSIWPCPDFLKHEESNRILGFCLPGHVR
jgi:hypothetical protein